MAGWLTTEFEKEYLQVGVFLPTKMKEGRKKGRKEGRKEGINERTNERTNKQIITN